MNDVLLSPLRLSELENLIEKSVLRALGKTTLTNSTATPPSVYVAPILSAEQVKDMTGWPNGTFYAKVAQMPDGVVIRGKSKRLLFDREKFMLWLKNPDEA